MPKRRETKEDDDTHDFMTIADAFFANDDKQAEVSQTDHLRRVEFCGNITSIGYMARLKNLTEIPHDLSIKAEATLFVSVLNNQHANFKYYALIPPPEHPLFREAVVGPRYRKGRFARLPPERAEPMRHWCQAFQSICTDFRANQRAESYIRFKDASYIMMAWEDDRPYIILSGANPRFIAYIWGETGDSLVEHPNQKFHQGENPQLSFGGWSADLQEKLNAFVVSSSADKQDSLLFTDAKDMNVFLNHVRSYVTGSSLIPEILSTAPFLNAVMKQNTYDFDHTNRLTDQYRCHIGGPLFPGIQLQLLETLEANDEVYFRCTDRQTNLDLIGDKQPNQGFIRSMKRTPGDDYSWECFVA